MSGIGDRPKRACFLSATRNRRDGSFCSGRGVKNTGKFPKGRSPFGCVIFRCLPLVFGASVSRCGAVQGNKSDNLLISL